NFVGSSSSMSAATLFFAHSRHKQPEASWHLLAEHLREVARMAAQFAREMFSQRSATPKPSALEPLLPEAAVLAGLLHDLGKYRPEFQAMLRGTHPRNEKTWHKQVGAAHA